MRLSVGSLFAGIGGFDLGLERAGMVPAWQVEIDPFCQKVLAHHWPDVERMEDVNNVGKRYLEPVDLICGGFPCQDLSVAGKRSGLAGERSGLWFQFHRILEEIRPRWAVIENVPGLLSSNGKRDFAVLLRGLVKLGYGVSWRILDAQYFGVAQRRRRVFIVGSLGSGRSAQVLFEREGSAWDSPPSRETGKRIADGTISRALTSCKTATGRLDPNEQTFCITPWDHESKRIHDPDGPAPTIAGPDGQGGQRMPYVAHTLRAEHDASEDGTGRGTPLVAATLNSGGNAGGFRTEPGEHLAVAFTERGREDGAQVEYQMQMSYALRPGRKAAAASSFGVRRLTPTERERLQGFPDNWTAVNGLKDSPRYRMLGNAVAVPVAEWIGRRIVKVEKAT